MTDPDTATIENTPRAFQDIAENLEFLDDWEDRYRYLIELGQALPPLPEDLMVADNKVSGCVSQVWLICDSEQREGETRISFRGDSDAMIVKGIVAVLLALYSGQPARFVAETDAINLMDQIGLREHLTAQRSNGLVAMVRRMRADAKKALSAA